MKRHSSRLLPAALVAAFALAACGGDTDSSAPADTGAPVPTVADDGLIPPRPIQITSGSGVASAGAASEAAPALDSRVGDMAMMPYYIADYVVGAGLPALPTNDIGYVFQRGAGVTADQVAALAAALGLSGQPVQADPNAPGSWRVGPDDGSAPMIWVSDDAQISWSYSSAWADQEPRVACAEAVSSDGTITSDCPQPEPPAGILTAAEAEQRARDIMTALGADPATYQFDTYADEWYASVSAVRKVDGLFDANRFDFGFGAEGVMQWAGGQLGEPQRVGPYPLIDLDTAIARLTDQNSMWGGGFYGPALMDDVAVGIAESDVGVAGSDGAGSGAVEGSAGETVAPDVMPPVDTLPVVSLPVDEIPEPEPVTVTLVDVQADVWWAWDTDGSVWLLPAYRFIDTDGGWHVVPAVTDEFLIQVEPPVVIEPMPVEPMPVPEPLPAPDTTAPAEPSVTEPPVTEPVPFDAAVLEPAVGTSLADFTAKAEELGATVRVVQQDGVGLEVTEDYGFNRVNVAVEGDVVTAIVSVG